MTDVEQALNDGLVRRSRAFRQSQFSRNAGAGDWLYCQHPRSVHSIDNIPLQEQPLSSGDSSPSQSLQDKPIRTEISKAKQLAWTDNNNNPGLTHIKKSLAAMELKMDGLQLNIKSVKSGIKAEIKDLSTTLAQHVTDLEKQRGLEKMTIESNNDKSNPILNSLDQDIKNLQNKNENIWKKLEQLNLRMTILSQRNSDSIVLLKEVQNLVTQAATQQKAKGQSPSSMAMEEEDDDEEDDDEEEEEEQEQQLSLKTPLANNSAKNNNENNEERERTSDRVQSTSPRSPPRPRGITVDISLPPLEQRPREMTIDITTTTTTTTSSSQRRQSDSKNKRKKNKCKKEEEKCFVEQSRMKLKRETQKLVIERMRAPVGSVLRTSCNYTNTKINNNGSQTKYTNSKKLEKKEKKPPSSPPQQQQQQQQPPEQQTNESQQTEMGKTRATTNGCSPSLASSPSNATQSDNLSQSISPLLETVENEDPLSNYSLNSIENSYDRDISMLVANEKEKTAKTEPGVGDHQFRTISLSRSLSTIPESSVQETVGVGVDDDQR